MTLTGKVTPLDSIADLEIEWRALEQQCDGSFFTSWSWIGPWLQTTGRKAGLFVYRCYRRRHEQPDELIALCVLGRSRVQRRRLFQANTLALNEIRSKGCNMSIEYNSLLAHRDVEAQAWHRFILDLCAADTEWEELCLSAIPRRCFDYLQNRALPTEILVDEQLSPWIVDLGAADTLDRLLSRYSSRRRWHIRRAMREYEKEGSLEILAAKTREQALRYFDRMCDLHTRRWNQLGQSGSYANPLRTAFHRELINRNFDRGEIQLLQVRCADRIIGYLYTFLWRGGVYGLQSGFHIESDNIKSPGYISHCLAMVFSAQRGMRSYDFLCGDSEYKKNLARPGEPLVWCRLQRPHWKFTLENLLLKVHRRLRPAETPKRTVAPKRASGQNAG